MATGRGIIVVGGEATVDAENADPLKDERYRAKYGEHAASLGFSDDFLSAYSLRLKIAVDKVWTTPTEPTRAQARVQLRAQRKSRLFDADPHVEPAHPVGDDGDRTAWRSAPDRGSAAPTPSGPACGGAPRPPANTGH